MLPVEIFIKEWIEVEEKKMTHGGVFRKNKTKKRAERISGSVTWKF